MKRGQVSVEYIATYGWAFMIIFGTLAALFYFNAFDLTAHVDSRCDFYSGIYCTEFAVTQTQVLVVIQNGLPIDITDVYLTVDECGIASGQTTLTSGEEEMYVVLCSIVQGSLFDSTLEFNYTNPDSGITHTKIGRILEKIN